jgi:pimeloyl-ACP methyl ester carboxylesterase
MHEHFAHQIEHFASTHRVIAPDLPGCGKSDAPQREYSIGAFADDIAWLCDELGVAKPVLVGHSMGGAIVLEVAAQAPDLPSAVVLLDTAVIWAPFVREPQAQLLNALRAEHYAQAFRGFAENAMFRPTDDPGLKTRVLDDMASLPQDVLASSLASYFEWTGESAASRVTAPTLLITAGDGPPSDVARFRELLPTLELGRATGAGHFLQLLVPDQVNAMIDGFLATIATQAAA